MLQFQITTLETPQRKCPSAGAVMWLIYQAQVSHLKKPLKCVCVVGGGGGGGGGGQCELTQLRSTILIRAPQVVQPFTIRSIWIQ